MSIPVEDDIFLPLHDTNGHPVRLRTKFIIAALHPDGENRHTTVYLDAGANLHKCTVREGLEEICGPFATLSWLKFAPGRLVSLEPNTGENHTKFPLKMVFSAPGELTFITSDSPEKICEAVKSARNPGKHGARP